MLSSVFAMNAPLVPEAKATSCPAVSPPKGVLYNHVSKTGGTVFKALLRNAMGALDGNKNVTYVNNGAHVDANSDLIGPDGALVIEDDFGHRGAAPDTSGHTFIHHDLQVNADDAANFFVIGLVRRPCDYQLSVWSSGSKNNYHRNPALAKAQGWWGASPPYDNDEDREKFNIWLDNVIGNRDSNRGFYDGNGVVFMSAALNKRYPDPSKVHCWVRTHKMTEDLKTCMQKYEACGGKYDHEGLSASNVAAAKALADEGTPPSEHAACSSFYNSSMLSKVMSTEQEVVNAYDLGHCCS
jgi:hypothetical protein